MIYAVLDYLRSCSSTEILGWITACISLTGAFLNANQRWYSFLVWMVANISWIVYDICNNCYSQAALFCAYLLMNIYGLYCWKFKKHDAEQASKTTLNAENSSVKTKSAA